jgi:1-acyl-sn-glycerol-3-phosphate acyltransferase
MLGLLFGLRFVLVSLPLLVLVSVAWPAVSLLLWSFNRSFEIQFLLAKWWARILLGVSFVRVQWIGREILEGLDPCLLIANHPSYLDVPVLFYALPNTFRFAAHQQLFRNPWLAIQLRTGKQLRVGAKIARATIKQAIRLIIDHGTSILIFPEEPHTDSTLHPFQEGAAYISIKAGIPVVPMALLGTRRLNRVKGKYLVTLKVGEPIPTAHLRDSDRTWLTKCLYERVAHLLNENNSASANSIVD